MIDAAIKDKMEECRAVLQNPNSSLRASKYYIVRDITEPLKHTDNYSNCLDELLKIIADSTPLDFMNHYGELEQNSKKEYVFRSLNGIQTIEETAQAAFLKYLSIDYNSFLKKCDQDAELISSAAAKGQPLTEDQAAAQIKPKITCVADVKKKKIQFLIEPYIAKNNITVLAGDGGVGKTFVWVDIASAITQNKLPEIMGVPFKTDTPNTENNKVLYLTSEDPTAEVLKERFEKAGANQENLYFVSLEDPCFHNITLESAELENIISEVKPALCVLDPLQSFVKGKMADRNNMRRQLDCLTRLGSVYNVSFLIIVHTNKLATSDARTKLSDSSDIWDKCRSVLFVGKTQEGNIRYLSQEKGNYTNDGNMQATHLFAIKNGRIEERGTTDKKYYEFATETVFNRDTSIRDDAKDVILDALKDGEMSVSELNETLKAYGIKDKTAERAKAELKRTGKIIFRTESAGKGKGTQWYISLKPIS